MPNGEEFGIHNPHLMSVVVFGSQNRKPNTSIGTDEETHLPYTFNFSRPRVAQKTT